MDLQQLLLLTASEPLNVRIDSRRVCPGDVFVALEGTSVDGHDFIGQAVRAGAGYVVCQKPIQTDSAVRVEVADTARAGGLLAQASAGYPASKMTNLAVTGTNGKTTVAYLVRSILNAEGKCGMLGTIEYDSGDEVFDAPLTTPDCLTVADMTAKMVRGGCEYSIAEASSHALSQDRLAGIDFLAAAFTNLAGDHLDYHGTTEGYLAAKMKLFTNLSPDAVAVINKQSDYARRIAEETPAKLLYYAVDEPAEVSAKVESMTGRGSEFELAYQGRVARVNSSLVGNFNVSNCLAAAGLCLAAGLELEQIAAGLSMPVTIPGRLEKVSEGGDFSVIVDYAHSDDALRNVIETLRPFCTGRLIVVFGAGGDRDKTKRPRMARVAEELADIRIVTSDNPRTEDPERIIEDILTGFGDAARRSVHVQPDRRKAIRQAIEKARKGDVILIAGKGHETYQQIGTERIEFDDKKVAADFLRKSQ